jgi:hypothetical protein
LNPFDNSNQYKVGAPDKNPSEEKVQRIFQAYLASLRALFEEHKHLLPPEVAKKGLTVIHRPPSGMHRGGQTAKM